MENSDYRPIPGQTPLTLPPKPEPAPVAPIPTTLPAAEESAPAAAAPVAAPVAARPIAVKPVATAPAVAKLPSSTKFISPMPKIEESNDEIPSFLPVVAGIAAAVTIAFSVLIYLKR